WKFGYMIPHGGFFPYWDGIFSPAGFLSEDLVPGKRSVLGLLSRITISGLGCLFGAGLLSRIVRRSPVARGDQLLLAFTFFSFCAILATPRFYDRYLLFLMPGLLVLAQRMFPGDRPIWSAGLVALATLAALSVGLTHDLWSWNPARWQ